MVSYRAALGAGGALEPRLHRVLPIVEHLSADGEEHNLAEPVRRRPPPFQYLRREREFFIDNLLVRIHFIIVLIGRDSYIGDAEEDRKLEVHPIPGLGFRV